MTSSLCSTKCTPPESGLTRSAPLLGLRGRRRTAARPRCRARLQALGPVDGPAGAAPRPPRPPPPRPPAALTPGNSCAGGITAPRPPNVPAPSDRCEPNHPRDGAKTLPSGRGPPVSADSSGTTCREGRRRQSSCALTPSQSCGSRLRRGRWRIEEPGPLFVARIAGQPLPRLIGHREPVVTEFIRVRALEDGRIRPREHNGQDRAVLQQPVTLDQPGFLRAESAARNSRDAVFAVEADGID